jgi:SnoaL-like domain
VVRSFQERLEARDWEGAGALLAPHLELRFSATGEVFRGANFLAMNIAYPEGWTIHVHEVIEAGNRVACQIRVEQDGQTFWCAGFYTVEAGQIVDGVEHWVTAGADEPPEWRGAFTNPD